ncbi:hypothetical protein BDV06DRAFT_197053 [Aspergillus oleicola]
MANRDYYGNNVPMHLVSETYPHETYPQQPTPMQDPGYGYTQAPQQQWSTPPPYAEYTEPAAPYQQTEYKNAKDPNAFVYGYPNAEEAEKGLGSTVVGGTGGAFVGHQVGKKSDHGTLGAIGGALVGAIGANMATNMVKKHNNQGQEQAQVQSCCGHGCGHSCGHSSGGGSSLGGIGLGGRLMDRKRARLERRLDRFH